MQMDWCIFVQSQVDVFAEEEIVFLKYLAKDPNDLRAEIKKQHNMLV